MRVGIKKLDVEMVVKNSGVEFEVYGKDDVFLGDMFVVKSGLIWCKGKTKKENGVKVSWADFTKWMEG